MINLRPLKVCPVEGESPQKRADRQEQKGCYGPRNVDLKWHQVPLMAARALDNVRFDTSCLFDYKSAHFFKKKIAVGPKTQSAHERDLELVSGADFWRNLHYFSSRGRSRGSRGPPRAPRGQKSAKNQRPDLSFYPPQGLPGQLAP